jgi:hypothetical protein
MTGSAKQSILSLRGEMDCFAALAMTVPRYKSAFPRRVSPGLCKSFRPSRRGRRERRVLAAPAVSCAKLCEETHTSIQVQSEHPGIPCAMVLRLMPRSPRRRIRLVTVVGELAVLLTRLGLQNLRRLDTSNGCQDHTVLPYAAARLRQKALRALAPFVWRALIAHGRTALRSQARPTLPRPPHPIPTFVTMANAPS